MAKFLQRFGAEKVSCVVNLTIHSVHADVVQPLSLTIQFIRGPQKDESQRFELNASSPDADINEQFSRESTFYKEKGSGY